MNSDNAPNNPRFVRSGFYGRGNESLAAKDFYTIVDNNDNPTHRGEVRFKGTPFGSAQMETRFWQPGDTQR